MFIILLVRGAFDLNEKRMNATAHDQNILHVDTLYNIMISVTTKSNVIVELHASEKLSLLL
jgi:hypothetical protein